LPVVSYPEGGNTVTKFTRNLPFLVFDGDDAIDGMRCTACKMCEKHCPPSCIFIIQDTDENGKKIQRPRVFDLDSSVCMSCGICVEVCPHESIWMDSEFELSTADRFNGLLLDRERLLKPNEYFHEIHPEQASMSDEVMAEKARKAAEREAAKKAREEAKAKKAAEAAQVQKDTPAEAEGEAPRERPPKLTPEEREAKRAAAKAAREARRAAKEAEGQSYGGVQS